MRTQYAFNSHDEMYLVPVIPEMHDRDRLSVAMVNALGEPRGMDLSWTIDDLVVEVKVAGVAAMMTHRRLAPR
jgi:hypothetical protein